MKPIGLRLKGRFRKRRWQVPALVCIALLAAVVHWSRAPRLEDWKRQMKMRGERFELAELLPTSPTEPDVCQQVIDRSVGKLRLLVAQRSRPAAGTNAVRPRWKAEQFHTSDGRTLDWPDAHREMAEAADVLDSLHAALRTPTPNPGWDYSQFSPPPGHWIGKRLVGQFLANATTVHLHRGDLTNAARQLHSLLALVRHHSEDRFFVGQMIRIALAGLAADITSEALDAPGWTEPQLLKLQASWSGIDLLGPLARAIEMERAVGSSYFSGMRTGTNAVFLPIGPKPQWHKLLEDNLVAPFYRNLWLNSDEWFYLKALQSALDQVRGLQQHRSWRREEPAANELFERLENARNGMTQYRYAGTCLLIVQTRKAFETVARVRTLQQMATTAIGIRRYTLEHGNPPASLQDLIPQYCDELPVDYADGHSLHYRVADRNWVLYGCGRDFNDDGGNPETDLVWGRLD